jgi:transcriptional regulator with XRE-family HTH domain
MVSLDRWPPTRGPVTPLWTLEALRAARALSIGELADAAGVSWSTAHRVLRGNSPASPKVRRALAAALGVDGPDVIAWPRRPLVPDKLG